MTDAAHPAPHRHTINFRLLAAALIATPAIWGVRLVVNYGIDSHYCFPGTQRSSGLPDWAWPTLLGVDLLAIVVAVASVLISLISWRLSREEFAATSGPLIEIGEGRTRFLALWGLMTSIGFLIALGFDLVALWITPACG
jgi:hypothetical protein